MKDDHREKAEDRRGRGHDFGTHATDAGFAKGGKDKRSGNWVGWLEGSLRKSERSGEGSGVIALEQEQRSRSRPCFPSRGLEFGQRYAFTNCDMNVRRVCLRNLVELDEVVVDDLRLRRGTSRGPLRGR